MSSESPSKGWVLHSATGRKFGPMSEDDLRHYFRAGMVKSVDRLTAPGDFAMLSAAEVAAQLGETAPAGPPPPVIDAEAPVAHVHALDPAMAAAAQAAVGERSLDPRAMEAIAKMQMEMAAARAPAARKGSGWLGPVVVVVALVALMFVALSMLKKIKPGGAAATSEYPTSQLPPSTLGEELPGPPAAPAASGGETRPAVATGAPGEVGAPLSNDPEFQAAFQRADLLRAARQWAELVTHARLWAQKQPDRSEPWQFLGLAHSSLGDHRAAAEAYERVMKVDPANRMVRQSLADAYLGIGKNAEAVALYAPLATVDARDPRMWNNYGMALRATGQSVQAAAALETAVRLDPNFKQAWTNLGQTYEELGEASKAAAAFTNAR